MSIEVRAIIVAVSYASSMMAIDARRRERCDGTRDSKGAIQVIV